MTDFNFTLFQAADLCGQLVYFSRFPSLHPDYPYTPGWYFVESVALSHSGRVDIGVEFEPDSIEYFPLIDVEIAQVGACLADVEAA